MRRSISDSRRMGILFFAMGVAVIGGCTSGRVPRGHGGGPQLVQGGVIFRYLDRDAQKVFLVGTFNQWSSRADPMVDKNGDGEWTIFFPLKPGVYEYKFVVDGTTWITDPQNPLSVPDGFDGRNSLVRVPNIR